jgi:Protein of unknown function (DUF1553)/Protein of unknown function (DUF1549)/Planctomycete cytochrome C
MRTFLNVAILLSMATALSADEQLDFFERKIRPVLVEHCYACHSAEGTDIEGGLRLDSRDAMRRGGESGPAVMPKVVEKSLLVSAIKYESLKMPPEHKLPDEVVQDFVKWVELGAPDPRDEVVAPTEMVKSEIDYEQGKKFWSFQRPMQHELPKHDMQEWCQTDVDYFIANALFEHDLRPSPPASSSTLLRRLSFDLTGLPPSDELLNHIDKISDEKKLSDVIDRLIGSTAFGEHWSRLWLDLMRYADDQAHVVGNNQELFFPNSYLYRNWVIDSLNRDMPYDQFIELQLAADLVTPDDLDDDVALGFMGLGPKYYRRNSPEVMADEWEDRVDILSRGLLGLTVACARCHDHKYDPIGTADYYALAGVFASVDLFNRPLDDERKTNDRGEAKDPQDAIHILRERESVDLAIMVRGDVNRKGPVVPKRFLTVLSPSDPVPFKSGSGRLELAKSIVSTDNPLTARVFVNRVWSRLIGQPLVGTQSNFGSLGDRPSHPELLDDLSVRFMQHGWSLKWLCREIVMSATYRQSSERNEVGNTNDEGNRYVWRMNRKRLSVEQWRDAVLCATGQLNAEIGGKSIDPSDSTELRRTLYSHASRLKLNSMLALFDYPDPNVHSERRSNTTTPSQKLFLLNSPFVVDNAAKFAKRLAEETGGYEPLLQRAYRLLYSREPSLEERKLGVQYLAESEGQSEKYLHALMIANPMLFID